MSKHNRDLWLAGQLSSSLDRARKQAKKSKKEAAQMLGVKASTAYKYFAGDIIPGGEVIWRACQNFGLVFDAQGLHPPVARKNPREVQTPKQYQFAFVNEAIDSERLKVNVRRKKDSEYMQVRLRIKVAG